MIANTNNYHLYDMELRSPKFYTSPYSSYSQQSPYPITGLNHNRTIDAANAADIFMYENDNIGDRSRGDICDILVPSIIYIAIRSAYILFVLLRW